MHESRLTSGTPVVLQPTHHLLTKMDSGQWAVGKKTYVACAYGGGKDVFILPPTFLFWFF